MNVRFPAAATVVLVTAAVALAGCSDDAGSGTSTTTVAGQGSEASLETGIQRLLDDWADDGPGGVTVAAARTDDELFLHAAGIAGAAGAPLEPDAELRVGSLSKTFVAVMLLQLVGDGTIGLDDLVTEHAPDLTVAQGVTVRQLLAHRSGIPEHTDGELIAAVTADPTRVFTPGDVLELVAGQPPDFPPGERYAYSNTNYIVAGVLLERLTGRSLAEDLQSRITEPLGLTGTYFAPAPGRTPVTGFSPDVPGGDTDTSSYRAIETAAWAAGALVSTAPDLATFIRALAHGELLPAPVYAEMTRDASTEGQGLGVFPSNPPSSTGIANAGSIPGFTSYMQYDPATQDLLVLLVSDDGRPTEQLRTDLLEAAAQP